MPQCVRFQRQYKEERTQQINLANPEALRKVRDTSDNGMAVTAAVRQLELMEERMDGTASGRNTPTAPGLVVVIAAADGRPAQVIEPLRAPVIDARPDEFGPADHADR